MHVIHNRNMPMAQESWVIRKVKVFHYDLDDQIISESILYPGDCTITYRGGHYLAPKTTLSYMRSNIPIMELRMINIY